MTEPSRLRDRWATLQRRCLWIERQLDIPNLSENSANRYRSELSALRWVMDIAIEKHPELLKVRHG